ncbi:hypothetical protein [Desulfoplanes sp.]
MQQTNYLPLRVLVLVFLFLSGCSSLSVQHLSPQPWTADTPSSLRLKFWDLSYRCSREDTTFDISGRAYPRTDRLPVWGTWLSKMVLTAYVSDIHGKVIARKSLGQEPGPLPPASGIPFRFTLTTKKAVPDAAITFGYRMVVLPTRPCKQPKNPLTAKNTQIFFASQEALRH